MERQVQGITMNYEEIGTGRPLLLLHGWACDYRHRINVYEPPWQANGWIGWKGTPADARFPGVVGTGADDIKTDCSLAFGKISRGQRAGFATFTDMKLCMGALEEQVTGCFVADAQEVVMANVAAFCGLLLR